ncbi:DNA helicase-2/ATP-dependent DNA helicase PcrA [Solirubrobacter pauli]|uniref:DNA 3'-5' helicase n=1 Tax=Solirubrobacter pauli TaxID=166793 RepID=A0A660L754_9ACTN|nr:ATP-dependent helicase [Solirubrobacter pauli]RKQ90842.1 DNA helicase-2/ATP-dependent DNA helicase PcrA [Solirubrobacter pauli]
MTALDPGGTHERAARPGADGLLVGLTPEQVQAVRHADGPLLIVAGPGTGKTRTLTHRVAHLLATDAATPGEILAVTFSVRAAGELRLRLADLLGEVTARGVLAATFHSVCARILREHATVFGRTDAYTIYDQADLQRVIETLLADHRRDAIQHAIQAWGQPPPAELEHEIALAKSRLLRPSGYEAVSRYSAAPLVSALWEAMEHELRLCNAFAFDDLLAFTVELLQAHPSRLAHLRARWRWLVVDEMQDTNVAQAALVHLLAGSAGNVTAVGDDDQAIYRFRSAEPRNILEFGARYPAHRQVVLGHNFRSRTEIITAAATCIEQNKHRHHKDLVAARGVGGRVTTRGFARDIEEAAWATSVIADALAAGTPASEILVLGRTAFATAPIQAALAAAGIPHRVLGSLGLYERAEVRDALAYLALLANPQDAHAFRRAIQAPRRGVGMATIGHVVAAARGYFAGDLITTAVNAVLLQDVRSAAAREALSTFGTGLDAVREDYRRGRSVGHIVVAALTLQGGVVAFHETRRDRSSRTDERRDGERVLEDLRSLCRAAQAYADQVGPAASITGFLEHVAGLHAEEIRPGEDRRITVSTIHRAKGTEAQLVVLLGCEEQLLPSWRALQSADPEDLEEERRLFYVAVTRAKDQLVLTRCHVRGGRATGGPSRFLAEAGLDTRTRAAA